MENFRTKINCMVMKMDVKESKKNEYGETKEYGYLSLYDFDQDKLIKVFIFDKYTEILSRYSLLNQYEIEMEASVVYKYGKIVTNYKILF